MISKIKNFCYQILKKSEKYFKTDMIYLAKGGFWLTLGQIVSSLSSFLLAIAFANLLPKEIYGTYKYVLSIASLLTIFTLPGINTALVQATARGYGGSIKKILKTKIKWGLVAGLIGLMMSTYYYVQNNNILALNFLILSVFIPFMDSLGIYSSYLIGKSKFRTSVKCDIIATIVSTIVIIITIFLTQKYGYYYYYSRNNSNNNKNIFFSKYIFINFQSKIWLLLLL